MVQALSLRLLTAETRAIVRVSFIVDEVALGQGFLQTFPVYPVNIISPMYHTSAPPSSFSLNTTLVRRTSGLSLGAFKQGSPLSDIGQHWTEKSFQVVLGNV